MLGFLESDMRYNLYRIFKNTGVRASYPDVACVFENYLDSISGSLLFNVVIMSLGFEASKMTSTKI